MQMFSVTAGSCFTKFWSAEQPCKFNSYVYPLQYCELEPVILNYTTKIPRKKFLLLFQKNSQAVHPCAHTLFATLLLNSALHLGFPISICGFRNIDTLTVKMYSLTTSEWMLRLFVLLFWAACALFLVCWVYFFLRKGIVCSSEGGFLDLS